MSRFSRDPWEQPSAAVEKLISEPLHYGSCASEPAAAEASPAAPKDAQQARQAVVKRWRKKRDAPRPDQLPHLVWEDNAPDWCWKLAKKLEQHVGGEPDFGESLMLEVLRWCDAGDPEARARRVHALLDAWLGPRPPMLRSFLAYARATKGGERKKAAGHLLSGG